MKKKIGALFVLLMCIWTTSLYALAPDGHPNNPHDPNVPDEMLLEDHEAPLPVKDFLLAEEPLRRGASTYGLDVSRYQGTINWNRARSYGPHPIRFMYAKSSQGVTIQDPTYVRNMTEARREGVLVGSYHYFSSVATGKEQCQYFMETIKGIHQDLVPVVDVEECSRGWGAMTLRRNLREFIDYMEEEYHMKPIIYTGVFFYNLYLSEGFKDCKLFLARYSDEEPLPNDLSDWTIWQFTEKGSVDGISGFVDVNRINPKFSLDHILLSGQHSGPDPHRRTHPHRHPNPLPHDTGLEPH